MFDQRRGSGFRCQRSIVRHGSGVLCCRRVLPVPLIAKIPSMSTVFRPAIQKMAGYVPGEQPQLDGWTKLNTNENPYPPSPKVVEAIRNAAEGRLNLYPDASAKAFREAAAEVYGIGPDWILPGNGSDENLTIIVRSFCDAGQTLAYPYPSYVLYESLAQIQGCPVARLPLNSDWQWDKHEAARLRKTARLFCVPNPNSPTGNQWTRNELVELLPEHGVLLIDQAYADFSTDPNLPADLNDPRFEHRALMTRTLSKSYSLAGIRFGFAIAPPELTHGMQRVKDSYNCDAVSIAAATAAIRDQAWMLQNRDTILATRERMAAELARMHFTVHPSEANFLWMQHATHQHARIYEELKSAKILVRFMQFPGANPDSSTLDGLRISVGTDDQIDRLLEALHRILDGL
jgi:histidinol-phosphate aminotransferase